MTSKNGILLDDKTIANNFAKNFFQLSKTDNIPADSIATRSKTIEDFSKTIVNSKFSHSSSSKIDSDLINGIFNISELELVLSKINKNSSPGIDSIPYSLFVHAPGVIKIFFLNIINTIWTTGNIPKLWKSSIIKPILKNNKDSKDLSSYRPISLTPTPCKIMEKMVVNRLNWFLEKNKLLNPSQAGFRKHFSTSDPIIRLKCEADFSLKSGFITVAILIDFTRAFGLIWTDGLLIKMMGLNLKGNILNWVRNFLFDRSSIVQVGDSFSDPFTNENGTPQGSSISPILFLIMVNDFPKLSSFTSDAFFADDCTMYNMAIR